MGMNEVGRLIAITFVSVVLASFAANTTAFAQAGSAGGTVGKQDKSISGGEDTEPQINPSERSSDEAVRRPDRQQQRITLHKVLHRKLAGPSAASVIPMRRSILMAILNAAERTRRAAACRFANPRVFATPASSTARAACAVTATAAMVLPATATWHALATQTKPAAGVSPIMSMRRVFRKSRRHHHSHGTHRGVWQAQLGSSIAFSGQLAR